MTVSGEIIKVLDDLCRRFGIAVDWTSENVLPYLQDLCSRYIQYEVFTSIAWCALPAVVLVISGLLWIIAGVTYKKIGGDLAEGISVISSLVFLATIVIGFFICSSQAFDIIIECYTIPEKVILEYIKTLLRTATQ